MSGDNKEVRFRGIGVSPGIAHSLIHVVRDDLDDVVRYHIEGSQIANEIARFEAALARAPVVTLLNAAEAAPDGVRKLAAALKRRADDAEISVVDAFTSAQLDLALGRSNVVHAALLAGPESGTFLARHARLERFRTGSEGAVTASRPMYNAGT